MWRRKPDPVAQPSAAAASDRLREALRRARIETAERTGVVVDLRDAEIARLELLNEALDAVFAGVPEQVELFDRGLSQGDSPRLWLDAVAHVAMARDKRTYRLLQDTRYGRTTLAESADIAELAEAVTRYVARRLIERERTLAGDQGYTLIDAVARTQRRRTARIVGLFLLGMLSGAALLLLAAFIAASGLPAR